MRGSATDIAPIHGKTYIRMLLQEFENIIHRRTSRKSQDVNRVAWFERRLSLRQKMLEKSQCQAPAPLRCQDITVDQWTRHSEQFDRWSNELCG